MIKHMDLGRLMTISFRNIWCTVRPITYSINRVRRNIVCSRKRCLQYVVQVTLHFYRTGVFNVQHITSIFRVEMATLST